MKFTLSATALTILTLISSSLAATPGISQPASGTRIMPGLPFNFTYSTIADYGTSSYNFTVWLFTTPPSSFAPSADAAAGVFLGRYDIQNYPGNPYAKHPPPEYFTTPDFSIHPGGFGSGSKASNVPVYLTVLEEYATGEGSLGYRMSLSTTELIYNATTSV